jgi:hypothetical protein
MQVKVGDTIRLIKPFGVFGESEIGSEFKVETVKDDGTLTFRFTYKGIEGAIGVISINGIDNYFEKVEYQPYPESGYTDFDYMIAYGYFKVDVQTVFEKTTIVTVKFDNDFVIVDSTTTHNLSDYDRDADVKLLLNRIRDQYLKYLAFKACDEAANPGAFN